ncbi:integrase arm-type DNA-binding domain-containing protein [Sphingopyxis sp.]|uniref:tyrosine-type recombinase/integrase n=1 Tax=Sphingopyxis sp. TaxID=1908224 RepID=UPI001DCC21BC|nr:integrase arm-type DNA-binding domain-containing protein [Sphingopyxis sp.]MBW8296192.1 tyrosine-type recombinase/integrase [Sphingopyxis sp.]
MPLTSIAIQNAKPREKPYKMGDALGLFLLIQPSGGKLWRLKYRIDGREKKLGLGTFPDVSLGEARKRRDEARSLIAAGKDPSIEQRKTKLRSRISADNTFGAIAVEMIAKQKEDQTWAPSTAKRCEHLLSLLRPSLWRMPITEIEGIDVYAAVNSIQTAGKIESAHRTMQLAGAVFRFAVQSGRLKSDPTRDLRGGLKKRKIVSHAAIIAEPELGALLRAIDGYGGQGAGVTRLALQIAAHVFVRPSELRHARWDEIDLDEAVWCIPPEKTKMRKPHNVPLSHQVIGLFRELHSITGPSGYAFPSVRTRARPMSENTINAGLRRLGYSNDEMTGHGFRSTASTLLNESRKWHPDAIERALSHGDPDKARGIYNRSPYWDERVKMAQWWSDYLDQLRKGGIVVPIGGKARA